MVQALAPDAAEEALAGGVLLRGAISRPQLPDAARRRDAGEPRPILAVAITDEIAGPLVERRGLAQLLRHPVIRRMTRDADMHYTAGLERDDEEGVEWAEEEVGDREEVAGPDVAGVVAEEGRPRLIGPARRAPLTQIALDRRLGHADVSLRSSPRMRSAPHRRLAAAISRIKATVSGVRGGRCAGATARECRRQCQRKRWRCQRSSVSGRMIAALTATSGRGWPRPPITLDRPGCSAAV